MYLGVKAVLELVDYWCLQLVGQSSKQLWLLERLEAVRLVQRNSLRHLLTTLLVLGPGSELDVH